MSSGFIVKRLVHLGIVMVVIALTVFIVMRLTPGDPAQIMLGQAEAVTAEDIERMRRDLGLDRALHVQAWEFFHGLATGDLGTSLVTGRPVWNLVIERFPATLELTLAAMFISFLLGIPIGVIGALKQNSLIDRLIMSLNFLGLSTPSFWQGIMFILLFSVILGWLPSMGRIDFDHVPQRVTGLLVLDSLLTLNFRSLGNALSHLILPAATAGTAYSAIIARVVRSSMLEVLRQDYIRTAWSKGLLPRTIVLSHALRNAMIPIVTIAGLEAGSLMSGSVVIETVFAWPGLGRLIVDGIFARDYPLVQSGVIILAFMFVMISLMVDVIYTFVDPRIKW